ncbi:MAG: hypothetical protein HXY34_06695 [Candidatus Thorarchaeota archaeon]|nr:hypothetical protein [Candidatus Thorarchaeota archaeon]
MKRPEVPKTLEQKLSVIGREISEDRYMIMEYLAPVVDGCRAALRASVDKLYALKEMSEEEIEEILDAPSISYANLTVCFRATDTGEVVSIAFEDSKPKVYDDCVDPDVVMSADMDTFSQLLDADSKLSPVDALGTRLQVAGNDSESIFEALGLMCFPPLWRMARSGIDPSSLLAEDADSLIVAAASDLVTRIVKRWIDLVTSGCAEAERH